MPFELFKGHMHVYINGHQPRSHNPCSHMRVWGKKYGSKKWSLNCHDKQKNQNPTYCFSVVHRLRSSNITRNSVVNLFDTAKYACFVSDTQITLI